MTGLAAPWQAVVVTFPPAGYFSGHGVPELEHRVEFVTLLLVAHGLFALAASLVLVLLLWRQECYEWICGRRGVRQGRERGPGDDSGKQLGSMSMQGSIYGYVGLKLVHLLVSIACLEAWPSQVCVLFVFAAGPTHFLLLLPSFCLASARTRTSPSPSCRMCPFPSLSLLLGSCHSRQPFPWLHQSCHKRLLLVG